MCAGAGSVEGPLILGVLGEGDLLQGVEMRRPRRAALFAELQGCLRLFAQNPFMMVTNPASSNALACLESVESVVPR